MSFPRSGWNFLFAQRIYYSQIILDRKIFIFEYFFQIIFFFILVITFQAFQLRYFSNRIIFPVTFPFRNSYLLKYFLATLHILWYNIFAIILGEL